MKNDTKYVEAKNDDVQTTDVSVEKINHEKKVDAVLFQGDMIVTKEQADEIIEELEENISGRPKRQAMRGFRYPLNIWSKGVNYAFYNVSDAAKRVFKIGASLWSEDTCIEFVENDTAIERIDVIKSAGCFSFVGKVGATQIFSLGGRLRVDWNCVARIGHALGFTHTQSRHDRDSFITLLSENVEPSGCGKILTATNKFQVLEHVGEKNATKESNGYAICNYWIKAPAGSKIEVVLDYFSKGLQ
ncbi:Astacin (Peptidase M12A) [Parelaphostrongylus tenuis]|uniref:Metalloendopeptidase n=1 Tax=Parelaphostrongylus tenuis TaxID=148309 RepID=A0AAD5QHK4_PARTN|nr:Astacin (Peptidase M12A) [Parelaphostrongylus tenuis]